MVRIMTTVSGSKSSGTLPKREKCGNTISVMAETSAKQNRMAVKGLMKAPASRLVRDFFFSWVTLLLPNLARLTEMASSSRPRRVVCRFFKTSLMGLVAAN